MKTLILRIPPEGIVGVCATLPPWATEETLVEGTVVRTRPGLAATAPRIDEPIVAELRLFENERELALEVTWP